MLSPGHAPASLPSARPDLRTSRDPHSRSTTMSAELELPPGVTLCDVPAGVNPDDPNALPNFDDPVSLQNITIAIAAICLFFASITLGGRLWVNKRNLKAADCTCAVLVQVRVLSG